MNELHDKKERLKFQLDRIALFSDAVFAIAITLLVIEIKIPVIPHENKEIFSDEFGHELFKMIPEFIGFFISFIVIGNYWKTHHIMFGFVTDYDRKLIGLNTWFLFTIICMPFTTGLMSHYMYFQPYLIYCLNIVVTGLIQLWMWRYIINKKNKVSEDIPAGVVRYKMVTPLVAITCFLFSLLIHQWLGAFIARMFLVTIFFADGIVLRYYKRKYQLGKRY